jgi:hypothetical protein
MLEDESQNNNSSSSDELNDVNLMMFFLSLKNVK